jgi:hypothetical protein
VEPRRPRPDPHARRAGFTQDDVRGILGGNYLRVFRQNLPENSKVYWDYRA